MSDGERKELKVRIKDAEKGIVEAVIAKLGVKDKDDDFTLPGAFGDQTVLVSSYGHGSWMGEMPVGKGKITEKGDEAVAEMRFFMSTTHGRDHFEVVKHAGELQEWSYGFGPPETGEVTEELRQIGVRRVLKKVKVDEVSPVLKGAGVDTRTLVVKSIETGKENGEEKTMKTELGKLLKELMVAEELSNGDLAETMCVPASRVKELLEGTPYRPSLYRLELAAKSLKTTLSRLRAAAETDGHDFTDEDQMRVRGAAAAEANANALKAQELAESAAAEAKAAVDVKTAAEAKEALERAEEFQVDAKAELERLNRNMERYTATTT